MNKEGISEHELIQKLSEGDESSYELIMRKYGGRLISVSMRYTNNYEDARDCVQQTFMQVFRSIGKFEERSSLWTWLRRIVINFSLQKIKSKKRGQEISIEDLMPEFDAEGCRYEPDWDLSESVDEIFERKEAIETINTAINKLPLDYRVILLLRDIEQYSTKETAEMMELEISTVKTRLHRARAALKKLLEPLLRKR